MGALASLALPNNKATNSRITRKGLIAASLEVQVLTATSIDGKVVIKKSFSWKWYIEISL